MRTEKKYVISAITAMKLKSALEAGMGKDPNNGEDGYSVRSLYFDSIYDNDFADKEDGLEFRKKIRLRTYSPQADRVKLEIKEKMGQNQLKRSVILSRVMAEKLIQGDYNCLKELKGKLPEELYFVMQSGLYRPKTLVEYNRLAFVLNENSTRITIDSNLRATEANHDLFSENLCLYPITSNTVLEVKYNRFLFDYIKDLIHFVDRKETAVSKYCLARQVGRI